MILKVKNSIVVLILLLAFTIPASPIIVDSTLVFIAGILALFVLFKEKLKLKMFFKTYLPLLLFYLILVIGLIYSENISKGFNQLEKKLTFIVLPLILFSIRNSINYKKILKYFALGVLFSAIICDLFAFYKFKPFLVGYSILLQPLDIDPTYFSMYCLFAMAFLLNEISSYKKTKKVLIVLAIIYLLFFYLRVGSKIGLILLFVIALYFGFVFFKKKSKKIVILIFLFLCIFLCVSFFAPLTYNRFYAPLIDNNFDFYQLRMKFFNERYYAWRCSIEAINIKSIWLGYGTGDDINVLKKCYEYYRRDYVLNSHNIYISGLIKNGLFGLFSVIFLAIQGFRTNNIQFIIFSIIIILTGLTESILERQKGIIFFTLFCTLILTEIQQKREKKCAA